MQVLCMSCFLFIFYLMAWVMLFHPSTALLFDYKNIYTQTHIQRHTCVRASRCCVTVCIIINNSLSKTPDWSSPTFSGRMLCILSVTCTINNTHTNLIHVCQMRTKLNHHVWNATHTNTHTHTHINTRTYSLVKCEREMHILKTLHRENAIY